MAMKWIIPVAGLVVLGSAALPAQSALVEQRGLAVHVPATLWVPGGQAQAPPWQVIPPWQLPSRVWLWIVRCVSVSGTKPGAS